MTAHSLVTIVLLLLTLIVPTCFADFIFGSVRPERTNAVTLQDTVVAGTIYVFVPKRPRKVQYADFVTGDNLPEINYVNFYLDTFPAVRDCPIDGTANSTLSPLSTQTDAPYDLMGTTGEQAVGWDTRLVSDGYHTIAAQIWEKNNGVQYVFVQFKVDNAHYHDGGGNQFLKLDDVVPSSIIRVDKEHPPTQRDGDLPKIDLFGGSESITEKVKQALLTPTHASFAATQDLSLTQKPYITTDFLYFSSQRDRRRSALLQEATLSGNVYVFVPNRAAWVGSSAAPPPRIVAALFYLDLLNPLQDCTVPTNAAGQQIGPNSYSLFPPWDLIKAETESGLLTIPWDTTQVKDGWHTLAVKLFDVDGGVHIAFAEFLAANHGSTSSGQPTRYPSPPYALLPS